MTLMLSHGYFLKADPVEQSINKPYPPLGLLSIAAYLKSIDQPVSVFDSTFEDMNQFSETLNAQKPGIVGLYVNMMTRQNVLEQIRLCKDAGSMVVLGGPEPVNYIEQYLDAGADVIVAGEGEMTMSDLVDGQPLASIPGIVYRADGKLNKNAEREKIPNLDSLPFPDRSAVDMSSYMEHWRRWHGYSAVSLITARGCPYTCRWCSHSVYGFSHRRRSPENVAEEVQLISDELDPDRLWYADDVFTINKKWLGKYATALEARGLKFPFETITREDRLDEEVVDSLARLGCSKIWIGAESGSQRILDRMDRRTNADRMRDMIELLKSRGIETGTFIMFGYDGETMQDIVETKEHLTDCLPDEVLTTVAYPIKGTAFYEEVAERLIASSDWADGSDRDLTFDGQKHPLFYRFTRNWISHQLALTRNLRKYPRSWLRLIKWSLLSLYARTGMHLTWRLRRND